MTAPPVVRKYRPELQGLRAVASLLVVVYHIWLGRVSGGVDVFFLISGFLITGQLVRSVERSGGIQFRPLWGRMIKRLFPAALTVLAVVMVASFLLLPANRWFQTIREIVASALYLENWQLAADSVDYLAKSNAVSPVQHFWSLSIQGQFYIVWPLLVLLVIGVAKFSGNRFRLTLLGTLSVVFTTSLIYSVISTASDQAFAYFNSLTRVWEFALGGLLMLAIDHVNLPKAVRVLLGWFGIAALVACGLVLQVSTVFPGYMALWPTGAALLVILAGASGTRLGVDWILSSRPLEYLGNISYALYLWHWPVLVFYLIVRERSDVGLLGGAFIIGVSIVLSMLTYHLVENPLRRSAIGTRTPWSGYRFGLVLLVPVLAAAGTWQYTAAQQAGAYDGIMDDPDHPGAVSLTPDFTYWGEDDVVPAPPFVALSDDAVKIDRDNCETSPHYEDLRVCQNTLDGPAERHIVVVGDSHSEQWVTALYLIAEDRNWRISSMYKGACPFSVVSETFPNNEDCVEWNAAAAAQTIDMDPDLVFTTATREVRVGLTEETPQGYVEQWRNMEAAGIPVIAMRDNPRYDYKPSECLENSGLDVASCSVPRAELLAERAPYEFLPDVPANVSFLDFSDYLCVEDVCPPVIGNVLVYLDENHISASYVASMAPMLEEAILDVTRW
ncbi:peptidoglycan/LPS O-acetylase OafA/YrhL [Actinoalloteichus hoggarensis]|uniref:acyltransferase family protein n=1 Tax=Actinoalloteichus hoggarensis TaxID=1470176 RepID=UPI00160AF3DE|nr:acyltransferase family protein [Actinoalloteichus hoggarensis]MBB5919649.1 peptidoglycan/LPS O-acetylase OafA/YrhL [Actinoalloteichus hoggarensis]